MEFLKWDFKTFGQLNTTELYAVLKLRNEVFVVEQDCVYQDCDDKDQGSMHLMGWNDNGELIAYSRVLPAGLAYKEVAIGRIVTSPSVRGMGFGKELMAESFRQIEASWGKGPIRIEAQCYLKKFYNNVGFKEEGDEFMLDGIPHIEMLKTE